MTLKWNYYRCSACHGFFVTVDRDHGKTAETLKCRATENCKGVMCSGGYPDPVLWPITAPKTADAEWFKPTWGSTKRRKYPSVAQAIDEGALLLRPIGKDAPTFPEVAK